MADNPLQVGHYKLLKTLGIGAFGKVKLGKHVITGHLVRASLLPSLPPSLPRLNLSLSSFPFRLTTSTRSSFSRAASRHAPVVHFSHD